MRSSIIDWLRPNCALCVLLLTSIVSLAGQVALGQVNAQSHYPSANASNQNAGVLPSGSRITNRQVQYEQGQSDSDLNSSSRREPTAILNGPNRTAQETNTLEVGQQYVGLVDFRDIALSDAMQAFSEQTGLNIVYSPEAGEQTIRIFLKNVTAIQALESITEAHGLYYRIDPDSGIIRISTTEQYQRDIASFRDEQTQVFTLLYPNPATVAMTIRNLYGNRVRMAVADQVTDRLDFTNLQERLGRFDLLDGRSLGLGINGTGLGNQFGLGFGGGGLNGGGLGGGIGGGIGGGLGNFGGRGFARNQFGGGSIGGGLGGGQLGFGNQMGFGNQLGMGNQFGQNGGLFGNEFDPIEGLSAEQIQRLENMEANGGNGLDEETLRLLMEREQASIFVTVIQRNNQIIVRTGDRQTMEQIESLIQRLDVPTPTVLLEVKIMRIELEDGFESAFDYQSSDGGSVAGGFSGGDVLPPLSDSITGEARKAASLALGGTGLNAGALAYQFVDESFRVRMQLLESKNRVTVLSAPLIMTANNEVSRIFVGDTLPFTVGFTSPQIVAGVNTNNTVAGAPITELRDVGQSLLITPNINADRSVTLRIVEENSRRLENGAFIPVPNTNGQIINQPVDTVQRQTVSGTIVAQDGLAVVLGGLIEETVADQRDQVPVLGKVPGLGFFFRRQDSGRRRSELVIMVRPYVFNTPAEAASLSQQWMCETSLHPNAPDGAGTMNTFMPHEVIRAMPPLAPGEQIFQFHSLSPKSY